MLAKRNLGGIRHFDEYNDQKNSIEQKNHVLRQCSREQVIPEYSIWVANKLNAIEVSSKPRPT